MRIEFDTPFDERYPLYTRSNAGEVFPEVLTPLAWSLLGRSVEMGFRDSYCRHFGVLADPGQDWFTIGRFAGRLHLNLSLIRTVAERLPGTSATANDRNFFGETEARGLPAHPADPEDGRWRRRGLPTTLRTMTAATRRVRRLAARSRAAAAETDAFLASGPTDRQLVDRLDELRGTPYRELFGTHMTVRALSSAPTTLAQQALVRGGYTPAEAMETASAVPGLESAKPSRALAAIAATVPEPVAAALTDRISWADLRSLDGAQALVARLDGFLEEFGHRGVNEFDPTVPSWGQDPDRVLALLRSLVDAGSPGGRSWTAGRSPGVLAGGVLRAARSALHRGEISKNAVILFTHQIRRLLFILAERWADRIDLADLRMLTLEEIRAVAGGGEIPQEVIARRRAEVQRAAAVEPAVWSHRELVLADAPVATGADVISGVGGSAGVARGRVRVLSDPYQDVEDGVVLVSRITDTAWTPLFLAAGAVVTDVGALLSHATIVARDLGIPAVVDTKNATTELRDGDLVEVDGTAGTVRVLERGPIP